MNRDQQVCRLDLAKRLKELGVKQESYAYWKIVVDEYKNDEPMVLVSDSSQTAPSDRKGSYQKSGTEWQEQFYAAFTVAELGEMLPRYILEGGFSHSLQIIRSSVWRLYYGENIYITANGDDTEADARAKMLIYLLENELITV